jgi:hypothetical protein
MKTESRKFFIKLAKILYRTLIFLITFTITIVIPIAILFILTKVFPGAGFVGEMIGTAAMFTIPCYLVAALSTKKNQPTSLKWYGFLLLIANILVMFKKVGIL